MMQEWSEQTLGDVCSISSVLVDPRKAQYAELLHVGGANIVSARGILVDLKTAKQEGLKSGKFVFDETMLLYSKIRPYLMKVARPDFRGVCSADIYPLSPDPARLDRDYLFYLLLTAEFTKFAVSGSARAGMPKVNREHLFTFKFPLPPISEQARIVGILEQAFEAVDIAKENTDRNVLNAKDLFRSYQTQLLARSRPMWSTAKLSELTTKIGSGATPLGGEKAYKQDGIPLIRSMNVYDDGFQHGGLAFLDVEQANKLEGVAVQRGDVLLNITGASVARCCIVPDDILPARVNQHVAILRTKPEFIDPAFLQYSLTAEHSKEVLLGIGSTGATRQAITKVQLESFPVSFPANLAAQRAICDKLDGVRESTNAVAKTYASKGDALRRLRESVLQAAFGGSL